MDHSTVPIQRQSERADSVADLYSSGVSWGAVIAGASAAAALSLILLALGAGLGLSAVSPWSTVGLSGATIGKGAILWLILMEIMASSMGGYLAGRLRTKWQRIPAHGFLAWSVGVVITAAFLTSAAASMAGGSSAPRASTSPAPMSSLAVEPNEYFVDMILRGNTTNPNETLLHREVEVIMTKGLRQGTLPEGDRAYLSQLVARRTGIPSLARIGRHVTASDLWIVD